MGDRVGCYYSQSVCIARLSITLCGYSLVMLLYSHLTCSNPNIVYIISVCMHIMHMDDAMVNHYGKSSMREAQGCVYNRNMTCVKFNLR